MEVVGESACAAGGGGGLGKVDIAAVLRESVSFGRFMTEPLEWGKWSAFSQNKYIEEAETYSTRGSVARKKAYFEEHYRRIALKKAAGELGQSTEEDEEGGYEDERGDFSSPDGKSETTDSNEHVKESENADNCEVGDRPNGENHLFLKPDKSSDYVLEGDDSKGQIYSHVRPETSDSEFAHDLERVRTKEEIQKGEELDGDNNRSQTTSLVMPETSGAECAHDLERDSTEEGIQKGEELEGDDSRSQASLFVRPETSSECAHDLDGDSIEEEIQKSEELELKMQRKEDAGEEMEVEVNFENRELEMDNGIQSQKMPLKENNEAPLPKPSFMGKFNKQPLSSLKPNYPLQSRKENNPSSGFLGKNFLKSSKHESKVSTENSLHMSIDLAPHHHNSGPTVDCSGSRTSKVSESRLNFGCFRAIQEFSSSRKTPSKDSAKGEPKVVPVTPQSENRSKTPSEKESATKNNTKWNPFLNSHGRSSCIGGNRLYNSQVVSTFFFRSEERAERRKEYFMKLEEKLNAEKLEREAKAKEKTENELKLLRQSLGFKARPLPKFYRRSGPPKQDSGTAPKPQNPVMKSPTNNPGRVKRKAVCSGQ